MLSASEYEPKETKDQTDFEAWILQNWLFKGKSASVYKVMPGILIISRNAFKHIWEHYEYPFLFFMDQENEGDNVDLLRRPFSVDELINRLKKTLVIYKSFELDVLWILKSGDIMFPDFKD